VGYRGKAPINTYDSGHTKIMTNDYLYAGFYILQHFLKDFHMEELIEQLKVDIIEALSLEDVVPEDFDADTPLFVEGLGLDSIDALELILLMERKYQVKIEDPKERRNILRNVRTMAECIMNHKN
jgi:acyl carrier protein